jgi:hypothetical protein
MERLGRHQDSVGTDAGANGSGGATARGRAVFFGALLAVLVAGLLADLAFAAGLAIFFA